MKRLFALFLCSIYILFSNAGFALAGDLYFVKNSSKENIKDSIELILQNKNYIIKQKDPYYAISSRYNSDYALIILQPSSSNYFYYYQSSGDESVNKQVLKALKKANIEYEQSYNQQYLTMFENQAQKVLTNTIGQYSFQQPSTNIAKAVTQQTTTSNNSLKGSVMQVAKGAKFKTYLETAIDTSTASVGDEVRAVLSENWIYNGKIVAPQGSLLTGTLSTARHASLGSRNGKVVFSFNTLTTPDGKSYAITTDEIDFTVTNDGKAAEVARNVLAGVAVGALTGLLIAACSKDSSTWKTTAISAGAGAAAGGIKVAAERGVDAEIPVYTELEVSLLRPFSIVSSY